MYFACWEYSLTVSRNPDNLNAIPFDIDASCLEIPKRRYSPTVFSNRYRGGRTVGFTEGKYIVLIVLEDLNPDNGLISWKDGPSSIKKGEWSYFKSDQEYTYGEDGGGLAIWLELKISKN